MAAQALAVCGDPEFAFKANNERSKSNKNTYVLLLALNAFQYSFTDDRLTLDDWERFEKKKFPENDADAIGLSSANNNRCN
jgi:N-sulfoglucosamine sulfohydrolase